MTTELRHRGLPNELLYELDKALPVLDTPKHRASAEILLSSRNMRSYLESRFRRKHIFRAVFALAEEPDVREKLLHIMMRQPPAYRVNKIIFSSDEFGISVSASYSSRSILTVLIIYVKNGNLGNPHLIYLLRLIGAVFNRAFNVKLCPDSVGTTQFVAALRDQIHLVTVHARQTVLREMRHIQCLEYWPLQEDHESSANEMCKWLITSEANVHAQKQFILRYYNPTVFAKLVHLLSEDFVSSTNRRHWFAVHYYGPSSGIENFELANARTGEMLSLSQKRDEYWLLVRAPVGAEVTTEWFWQHLFYYYKNLIEVVI